jgi:hypothetical protein
VRSLTKETQMAISRFDIDSSVDRLMFVDGRGHLIGLPNRPGESSNTTTGVPTDGLKGWAPGALFFNYKANPGTLYVNRGTYASSTWVLTPVSGDTLAALTVTTLTSTTATITTLVDTKETAGVGASTAAAGNAVGNAGALPAGTAKIYPTTAADDTKGVVIDAADQVTGRVLLIGNGVSNKILKVYGPSGAVINGAAADAAFSSASGKGVIAACLSGSGNTWLMW